jgi:hypothetical protein
MKTKICKQCNNPFELHAIINGKWTPLYARNYCLKCSPFGEFKQNKAEIVNGERRCIECEEFHPLSEFSFRNSGHHRSYCHTCENQRSVKYGRIMKQRIIDYLGGKCSICNYNKSSRALHAHHRDPSQKLFTLSERKCLNWEDTKRELDKCILVCANCHGEIHDGITPLPTLP